MSASHPEILDLAPNTAHHDHWRHAPVAARRGSVRCGANARSGRASRTVAAVAAPRHWLFGFQANRQPQTQKAANTLASESGMRWIAKAVAAKVLSTMPGGREVHRLIQRHVTRTLPPSEADFRARALAANRHLTAFARHGRQGVPLKDAVFLEFGAGWDLAIPIMHRLAGVGRQLVFDVQPLARPELVQLSACRARAMGDLLADSNDRMDADPERIPAEGPASRMSLRSWLESVGIEYRAPGDARDTGLRPASVDCVTSTFTLEHIPAADVDAIFCEMYRVLRPRGVLSSIVDMSDHFSHADSSLSPWHFLRFSDRVWRLVNSALLYQNRLRASSYVSMARAAGFDIVEAQIEVPPHAPTHVPPMVHPDVAWAGERVDLLATRLDLTLVRPR